MSCETGCRVSFLTAVSEEGRWLGLVLQLQAQLEEMFSDKHLEEDGFLLKHIQKNREGFVSLKLLTCLKKIKVLTDNWYMTLTAALMSPMLEVNEDSNKVRRCRPYPDWLLCSPTSKLLLFWSLSPDWTEPRPSPLPDPHTTLSQHILNRLSSYGTLLNHWLLLPGQAVPKELQCYTRRQRELGQELCAVVKFSTLATIRKAYGEFKAEEVASAGRGVHVVSLGYRSAYLLCREQPAGGMSQGDTGVSEGDQREEAQGGEEAVEETLDAGDSPTVPLGPRRRNKRVNLNVPKNLVQVTRQPHGPDDTKGFRHRREPIA